MDYPFKHLAAYERKDKAFYSGREKETRELYRICFETDLILLYGASGVGKSSLISCGLANKFEPYEWLEIPVRRGHNINNSLTEKLNIYIGDESNETDISRQIQSLCSKCFKPVYLIFDQFEELYISGTEEEQELFYENVKTILSLNQPVKIIISIREEYLGYLYEFEKKIPQLFSHKYWVKPLKLEIEDEKSIIDKMLQSVIDNKAESYISIQDGDKDKLVNEITEMFKSDAKTVDLPSLQILFDEFYFSLTKDNTFATPDVVFSYSKFKEKFNGNIKIQDILWQYLEKLVSDLSRKEKIKSKVVYGVLLELVTERRTKKILMEKELQDEFSELEIKLITDFFSNKQKGSILNRIEQKGEMCYELRHDALAKCIREKLDNEIRLKSIINQKMSDKSPKDYLTEFQLKEIDRCRNRLFLTEKEKKWVEKCKWRIRRKRLSIVGVFVIVSLLLVFAIWQWQEAIKQSAIAEKAYSVFYFYDNKYALANSKHGFYFIDKDGDPVDNLGYWDKAEQFNENTGFAKVTGYRGRGLSECDKGEFLLDTLGMTYKYSKSINELNCAEALDLSGQPSSSFDFSLIIGKEPNLNLKYLKLNSCRLTTLPPEIGKLTNLKLLTLGGNFFINIPAEIGNLTNLEELDLSGDLENFLPEIGKLTNLKRLTLYGTSHTSVPAEIGNLTNLEELDLSGDLENFLPEIGKLTNLKKLTLWNNNFTNGLAEIGNLTDLEELDLSFNLLDSLPPEIGKLTNLKKLNLGNNELTDLPPEIGKLTNLEALYLRGNQLTSLPPEIGNLVNLYWLDLDNKIIKLPKEIVSLKELYIYNSDELLLDSISKSYLEEIDYSPKDLPIGIVIEGGAAYKKGLRGRVIILKYGDWEINRKDSLSEEIIDKYDDKEKDIIVVWDDGEIRKWELFHFDKGTVGLNFHSIKTTYFGYWKQRLRQFKDDSMIKYKGLYLWDISHIFVYYKSRFP
ncbi:MAG: leucine-rich repeat domain-containing protein [Tannerella sp.]|jgi:hypothetical protein|nr:leucine-rich repeat domain-containing protein [Tannerella sp.]